MKLRIMGKDYEPEYVEKAVLFLEHIEKHIEVIEAPEHGGEAMCKICETTANDIWRRSRN